VEQLMLQ